MKNDKKSPNNNKANADKLYMLDAELLPLIEKANNGCFDSQVELANAFTHGEGAKINDSLAAKYEEMIFDATDNNLAKLAILWNIAIREKDAGEYEAMQQHFHTVINFMQENIPMKEWDFSLFAMMEEFTQLRDDILIE